MEPIMKISAAISAIVAISLASSGVSFAQGAGDRGDRGDRHDRGRDGNTQRGNHQDRQQYQGRWSYGDARQDERGAGPNHDFRRGGHLPAEYRHRQYVVDDWRGHNLSAPPRGYHWIQTGGDYVLVAIATGVILQLLLNN
jgi:Ni/Co efflux regulator RcnB